MNLGCKIKKLRLAKGITQEVLADYLGVSYQAVSRWENSASMPDIQLLPKISIYFGVTIDELFELNEESKLIRIDNMLNEKRVLTTEEFYESKNYLVEISNSGEQKAKAYELLGQLYSHKAENDYEMAVKYSKMALQEDNQSKTSHNVLVKGAGGVICDWNCSNHHKLIEYYYEFVDKNSEDWHGYLYLMDNLIADYRLDEARVVLNKFKKIYVGYLNLAYEGQILLAYGKEDKAFDLWSSMVDEYKDNYLAWFFRADQYAKRYKYCNAIEDYVKSMMIQPKPRMSDGYEAVAHIYEIQKNYKEAINYYRLIIDILKDEWNIKYGEQIDKYKREIEKLIDKI